VLINLGFLVVTLYYSPAEMVRLASRRVSGAFRSRP
jgi:hypothetical protein